jgi:hypothetical protein
VRDVGGDGSQVGTSFGIAGSTPALAFAAGLISTVATFGKMPCNSSRTSLGTLPPSMWRRGIQAGNGFPSGRWRAWVRFPWPAFGKATCLVETSRRIT